ncbi:MAG: hypothetical protein FJY98_02415 [Candidatus Liptonbacteria bacterium]|nr:hypothetical protein [Candidatus Liptonbacteria bacterium]
MSKKTLGNITGGIFILLGILNLVRFAFRWEASLAGREIPLWVSLVIALLAGYIAYESFRSRTTWFVCTGGCKGSSSTPGTCQAEDCAKKGHPLEAISA